VLQEKTAGAEPLGVRIRRATGTDSRFIDTVESTAFGLQADRVVSLVHGLRLTSAAVVELVAEDAEHLVGHVVLSRGWLDAPAELVEVLVLSPLAVVPSQLRRGIGRRLIEKAVSEGERSNAPAVFLEGDPGYYSSSGFVPAAPLGFRSPSSRIPDGAFQVRPLSAFEPWMTGALVYPEAFWIHDAVGLR
jgi:putative acetyltransferase